MGTAIAKQRATKIGRPLKILIPLIKQDLEQGDRAGMAYYADAGDKLIEAKEQVSFGHWSTWLSKNFHLSHSVANRYMRLSRLRDEQQINRGSINLPSSLNEMEGGTERRRARSKSEHAFKSVLRDLETDLYAQEQQTRTDEVQLHRDLALEVIDIGYKALATKLHPDHGGSKEAMARLNRVRAELKGLAETRRFV